MSVATSARAGPRIRLLPMFPFSVVCGGMELQCVKTRSALAQNGIATGLLDYYNVEDRFDLLHLFGSSGTYYDICRQIAGRCPWIVSAVCGAPRVSRWRTWVYQGIAGMARLARQQTNYERLRFVFQQAAAVLCLNELEAAFLKTTYQVSDERLRIVPNGVDDEYFHADGRPFCERYGVQDFVLFTGNIIERKNPLRLARVLNRMNQPGVFIGGTLHSEQGYAAEFADTVERSPNLLWIKRLDHADPLLASAYGAASVFCLPSSSETQSLSALEAMAAGRPVVVGDFPYARQAPLDRALRCRVEDEHSIQACLEAALANPAARCIPLEEAYRWRNVGAQIAAVYRHVLADSN